MRNVGFAPSRLCVRHSGAARSCCQSLDHGKLIYVTGRHGLPNVICPKPEILCPRSPVSKMLDEQDDVIEVLKSLVEGRIVGGEWHKWRQTNETRLKSVLSPGSFLRLKFHPLKEAKSILEKLQVSFQASDLLEWLDSDSKSGKCRFCGEKIVRAGPGWAWCPKGCFHLMT